MMTTQPERALCEHRVLDTIVHEFILREGTRAAVNEMFDILEKQLDADLTAFPCLIDASNGMFAVAVVFTRIRVLSQKFPGRPRRKIAMLLPDNSLTHVIDTIMRPFGSVRIFHTDAREQALEWLRPA